MIRLERIPDYNFGGNISEFARSEGMDCWMPREFNVDAGGHRLELTAAGLEACADGCFDRRHWLI